MDKRSIQSPAPLRPLKGIPPTLSAQHCDYLWSCKVSFKQLILLNTLKGKQEESPTEKRAAWKGGSGAEGCRREPSSSFLPQVALHADLEQWRLVQVPVLCTCLRAVCWRTGERMGPAVRGDCEQGQGLEKDRCEVRAGLAAVSPLLELRWWRETSR